MPELRELPNGAAQEVKPGVFLGGSAAALDKESLKGMGITHVLTANGEAPLHPNDFKYKTLSVTEKGDGVAPVLPGALQFIDEATAGGGSVLVHCTHGTGRSAALVIAHVMQTETEVGAQPLLSAAYGIVGVAGMIGDNVDAAAALSIVKERRPGTDPPTPYSAQLDAWAKN
ncbi:protein-tyrosine phosphatase-like protein [Tribonema minus]|uniref:Protein-tyrosine phosphatase-like protein n=1 Tax=Tribonema minus TaxID=303371 RepID=A0A835Z9I7_9STRA|nr:protein-tyrosine phosphatase-like protein [Tribonema minus]